MFRRWLSRALKARLNFGGYFDLYNFPFEYISLFDFAERKSPLRPGGLNRGPNIFDYLEERQIPYYVSDPESPERANLDTLLRELEQDASTLRSFTGLGLMGCYIKLETNRHKLVPSRDRRIHSESVARSGPCPVGQVRLESYRTTNLEGLRAPRSIESPSLNPSAFRPTLSSENVSANFPASLLALLG